MQAKHNDSVNSAPEGEHDQIGDNSTQLNTTIAKDPLGGGTINESNMKGGDSNFLMENSIGQSSVAHAQGSRIMHNDNLATSIKEEGYENVIGSGQASVNAYNGQGDSTVGEEHDTMVNTQVISNG